MMTNRNAPRFTLGSALTTRQSRPICELTQVAERRGWTVVETYRDAGISDAKGRDRRPGLDAVLKNAQPAEVRYRHGLGH